MVKHIKKCNLSNTLDQGQNVYFWNIPEANVRSMKHYMKPYTGKENPVNIIFRAQTKTLILKQIHKLFGNQLLKSLFVLFQ